MKNKRLLKTRIFCICGHTHVSYVGDLGRNHDEEGYDRITMCDRCKCEKFRRRKNDR